MSGAADLPYALGPPPLTGTLRAAPEDFIVDEDLGFAPDGAGEHAFVRVEKRGANTEWVARQLARHAGVAVNAVSFAGLKDRHALTRQTFSVHLPGKPDPDWSALRHEEFRVLGAVRHRRKLQRGTLAGNAFHIVIRGIAGDRTAADERIAAIRAGGVPNYFGEQRFGHDDGNVARARALFAAGASARALRSMRHEERSLLLSAARSHIFNAVLADRVAANTWNRPIAGDVFMLSGSRSIFGPEPITPELAARIASGDISPTGPLWGEGDIRTRDEAAQIEHAAEQCDPDLAQGLAANGLRQERRALVLRPHELQSRWLSERDLEIRFVLGKGSYATVVVREIVRT